MNHIIIEFKQIKNKIKRVKLIDYVIIVYK